MYIMYINQQDEWTRHNHKLFIRRCNNKTSEMADVMVP